MKWFINLSTRNKLVLGFGAIWLLMAVVIVTAYVGFIKVIQSERDLSDIHFTEAIDLMQLRSHQNYNRGQILEMILTADRSKQEEITGNIKERTDQMDALIEGLLKLNPDPQFQSRLAELKNNMAAYRETREQEMSLIVDGKIEETRQLALEVQDERFNNIRSIAMELGDKEKNEVK